MPRPDIDGVGATADRITERGPFLAQATEDGGHECFEMVKHGRLPADRSPQRNDQRACPIAAHAFVLEALDEPGRNQARERRFDALELALRLVGYLGSGERALAVH